MTKQKPTVTRPLQSFFAMLAPWTPEQHQPRLYMVMLMYSWTPWERRPDDRVRKAALGSRKFTFTHTLLLSNIAMNNWDDDIPNWMEVVKFMFQTTNQFWMIYGWFTYKHWWFSVVWNDQRLNVTFCAVARVMCLFWRPFLASTYKSKPNYYDTNLILGLKSIFFFQWGQPEMSVLTNVESKNGSLQTLHLCFA